MDSRRFSKCQFTLDHFVFHFVYTLLTTRIDAVLFNICFGGYEMKNNLTEVVAILDMSGSMSSLKEDTIGSYNTMLKEQQEKDRRMLVTTYVFNNDYHMVHDRVPISEVSMMTDKDYRPSGCTALLDTMGDAIRHIEQIHHYARAEDVPEHTVFFIITDGLENASRKYSSDDIKKLVGQKREASGWEFIYLASNIDAVETASHIGIPREMSVDYMPDVKGTRTAYKAASRAMDCITDEVELCRCPDLWRDEVDKDFLKRK